MGLRAWLVGQLKDTIIGRMILLKSRCFFFPQKRKPFVGRVTSCFRLTSVRLNEAKKGREEQEELSHLKYRDIVAYHNNMTTHYSTP